MAFSWSEEVVPAGTSLIPVNIEYLDKSYIHVYIDNILLGSDNYSWNSDVLIQLNQPLSATSKVSLVRRTDKTQLYIMFAEGAAFIKENLDTQNTQFLHLVQELVEGRSIDGFYGDISMNGYRITNLGDGVSPGDAVNKGQLDEIDQRVSNIEGSFVTSTTSYPFFELVQTTKDTFSPPFVFDKAAVYINGLCQVPGYSYVVVDNQILLAEPVPAGTEFMARLGEDVTDEDGYATVQQLMNAVALFEDSATLRTDLLKGPLRERGMGLALRDFVTPEDFDAPANGVDNDSPAAQLALNAAIALGKPLLLNGNYCFFDTVEATTTRKVSIAGTGVIHHKKGAFKLSGVVGPEIDTTVSITDFNATSLSLANAAEFNLNDLGIIHSATMCLSEDAGSMQLGIATASGAPSWFGEFFRVNGKSGNTVNLTTPLIFNSYRTTPQPNSGARTKTTVKKVTPVRGSISGNLTFLREGNATTAVEINYGDGFTVKGRFYSGKIAGAAVVFKYSYMCEVGPGSYFNIDADTPINFGSVVWPAGQVSAGDYYNFNSVKCVSSQMCGCSGAMFENTSQTFDITYDQMPSIGCYFKGNKVMFARHNVATSHGGSYANMFDSNLGVACWRGIASRSREDCITNNRIYGFRRNPINPNTGGETYGIGLTEGFTIGNTVTGNYISGFLRDVYINAASSRGAGLDYMGITIEGNRMSYCRHHVDVDLSTPSVKGTESGISISNNEFDSNTRQSLNFGQYLTAVIIRNNVWVDAPSEDFYVIAADSNCKNFDISGNSFKKSTAGVEKYVWMKSITDPDLGPDTVQNSNVTFRGNVVRGVLEPDGFVYGTTSLTRLPAGNGFDTFQTGGAMRLTGITGDYTLDSLTHNNVNFVATTPFNLVGITGGNNGRDLVLWNTSANNPVTVKNSATVQTRSNADFVLTANTPLHLRYMNNKWREV